MSHTITICHAARATQTQPHVASPSTSIRWLDGGDAAADCYNSSSNSSSIINSSSSSSSSGGRRVGLFQLDGVRRCLFLFCLFPVLPFNRPHVPHLPPVIISDSLSVSVSFWSSPRPCPPSPSPSPCPCPCACAGPCPSRRRTLSGVVVSDFYCE